MQPFLQLAGKLFQLRADCSAFGLSRLGGKRVSAGKGLGANEGFGIHAGSIASPQRADAERMGRRNQIAYT